MASASFNIVNGPSLWDMHLALFDRKLERALSFPVEDKAVRIGVATSMIRQHPHSKSGWQFEGVVRTGPTEFISRNVIGEFDTDSRRGKLEIEVRGAEPPEHEIKKNWQFEHH